VNELMEKLEHSFTVHRHFIADAAHQLRTPLAILSSELEVGLKENPQDCGPLLQRLLDTTQRAVRLASQLLSLAKLENANDTLERVETVALEEIARAAAARYVAQAERSGVGLEFQLQPLHVLGESLLLEELLGNLLENAILYTGRGGQVFIAAHSRAGYAILSVIDNGPGVEAATRARLGTPFFRERAYAGQPGSGLGLAIVKEIARLHGGAVEFREGLEGRGLRVEIRLPLAEPPAAA
jgi:two-component system sensor histidine kinase TctE